MALRPRAAEFERDLSSKTARPASSDSIERLPYQVVNANGQPSTNIEETGIRTNITPQIMGQRSDSVKLAMNFAVKSLVVHIRSQRVNIRRPARDIQTVKSTSAAARVPRSAD